MYPALINCVTIDWFGEWPEEALIEVANRNLDTMVFLEKQMVCIKKIHNTFIRLNRLFTSICRSLFYLLMCSLCYNFSVFNLFLLYLKNFKKVCKPNIAILFCKIHKSVKEFSLKMQREMRRTNYVTSNNYLELVKGYKE